MLKYINLYDSDNVATRKVVTKLVFNVIENIEAIENMTVANIPADELSLDYIFSTLGIDESDSGTWYAGDAVMNPDVMLINAFDSIFGMEEGNLAASQNYEGDRGSFMNIRSLEGVEKLWNEDGTRYLDLSTLYTWQKSNIPGVEDWILESSSFTPFTRSLGDDINLYMCIVDEKFFEEDSKDNPYLGIALYPYFDGYGFTAQKVTNGYQAFNNECFRRLAYNQVTYDVDDDPFEDNPNNDVRGIVGGGGKWIREGDTIGLPGLPSYNAAASGMLTIYAPTEAQVRAFSGWLWSANIFDTLLKMWTSPMENIISFHMVPVPITRGAAKAIVFAGIDSGCEALTASSQFVAVDCGTITLQPYSGSYADYDNVKISLFLPYIGSVELSPNEVFGTWKKGGGARRLKVEYYVDILTGACTAFVLAGYTTMSTIGSYTGNCLTPLPISARDMSAVYSGILQMATSGFNAATQVVSGAMTGGEVGAVMGAVGGVGTIAGNTGALAGMHPRVAKSGNVAGAVGISNNQKPYITIHYPNLITPAYYNKLEGYPLYATYLVRELKGLTRIANIHLDDISGITASEIDELDAILKGGVIL